MVKAVLAVLIGGAIGAVVGKAGKCETGGCPLTANPYIGGVYGGLVGLLFATAFINPSARHAERSDRQKENPMATTAHAASIANVTDPDEFQRIVGDSSKPALVDFWAPWCGPCRTQAPILDELASQMGDSARIVKVDVDEAPEIAARYGVRSIPTLIVFREGKQAKRFTGVQSAATLAAALGS